MLSIIVIVACDRASVLLLIIKNNGGVYMVEPPKNSVEILTYGTFKVCGTVTRQITEGFYTIVPFMRPRKRASEQERKSASTQEDKSASAQVMKREVPLKKPTIVEQVRKAVSAPVKTAEKALDKAVTSNEQRATSNEQLATSNEQPATSNQQLDSLLSGIEFSSKIEKLQAEIYVKDFGSKSSAVRDRALSQIKKMSSKTAVPLMTNLLNGTTDVLTRAELLNTLNLINEDQILNKGIFREHFKSESPIVRMAALRGLARYKDDESFDILEYSVKNDISDVRRQALNLLCWTYGSRASAAVMSLIHDVDNSVRKTAVHIAGSLKLKTAISPLITCLSDPDQDVQKSANDALKKITKKDLGFDPKGSEKNRKEAIEAWCFWWRDQGMRV